MASKKSRYSLYALALAGQLNVSAALAQAPQSTAPEKTEVTLETVCKLHSEFKDAQTQVTLENARLDQAAIARSLQAFSRLFQITDPAQRATAAKLLGQQSAALQAELRRQKADKTKTQRDAFDAYNDAIAALVPTWTEQSFAKGQIPGMTNLGQLPPDQRAATFQTELFKANTKSRMAIMSAVENNPDCAGKLPPPPPQTPIAPRSIQPKPGQSGYIPA